MRVYYPKLRKIDHTLYLPLNVFITPKDQIFIHYVIHTFDTVNISQKHIGR